MLIAGVDPGKEGAIAFIDTGAGIMDVPVWVVPMPLVSGKGRDEYDLRQIMVTLRDNDPDFVMVEKSQPLPPKMGGGIANYSRGVGRGWEWMLVALELPYQLVAPVTWQKAMHAGTPGSDTKQRSVIAAQRLFPSVSLTPGKKRKPHDGMADALLLAEFGRRIRSGLPASVEG